MAVAYENIAVGSAGRVAGQYHSFDQGVGVALEDSLVVVGAGVALFAVAQDVLDRGIGAGQEPPLGAGGEGCAAPPAEAGVGDLGQGLFGGHLGEGLV